MLSRVSPDLKQSYGFTFLIGRAFCSSVSLAPSLFWLFSICSANSCFFYKQAQRQKTIRLKCYNNTECLSLFSSTYDSWRKVLGTSLALAPLLLWASPDFQFDLFLKLAVHGLFGAWFGRCSHFFAVSTSDRWCHFMGEPARVGMFLIKVVLVTKRVVWWSHESLDSDFATWWLLQLVEYNAIVLHRHSFLSVQHSIYVLNSSKK